MSHFTVLVIGDRPHEQLAPYDENIKVPEYLTGKLTKDDIKTFMQHYRTNGEIAGLSFEQAYEKYGKQWNGNNWRKVRKSSRKKWACDICKALNAPTSEICYQCTTPFPEDKKRFVWMKYSTYNPDSKWDWYELGGRWKGYFRLKDGASGILGQPGVFDNEADPQTADVALKRRH
jgi:hypothetical protein